MTIDSINNEIFNSRTYILQDGTDYLIVDCGDVEPILEVVGEGKVVGVLITHGHFDHIYGLNILIEKYPDIKVYGSKRTIELLYDAKQNYSRYHESPFIFQGRNTIPLTEGKYSIGNFEVEVYQTPGHDAGCLTFRIGDRLFTGDSYIPQVKTITNLRGNKIQAAESEQLIKSLINEYGLTVCAGHNV